MDTKKDSAVSDVPTFKVARVGNDRKKKGAGFSFLRGGGTRGAWSGATGGAGSGGAFAGLGGVGGATSFFASTFTKAMLSILVAAMVGSAAIYAGAHMGGGETVAKKKSGPFADKEIKLEGDTTNLPGNTNTIPNSLGYLSGSRDGLTAEERAKKEAEAAEAQRLADEEAKKKAEEEAKLAANPAVDPNALLASAKSDGAKGPGLGKKFGSLSSSFGGGGSSLSGGAGLSGGVGRGFGGGGSLGKASNSGKLSAMSGNARPTYSKAGGAKVAPSNAKGFARRQLANANALSRRAATASKGENAAYDAAQAFDNNQGAGSVISGPGIGNGGRPNEVSDGSVNPRNDGGPMGNTSTGDCGAGNIVDPATGGCKPIPKNDTKDDTKYDWMYQTAQAIMVTLTVLSMIALASHAADWVAGAGAAIQKAIGAAMVILGGILVALGVAMIALTGDKIAGGIIAACGAWTAYTALTTPETTSGEVVKQVALKIFVPTIVGGFASAMAHKPAAANE